MLNAKGLVRESSGGQRQVLAPDALHLADPGVGFEFGHGERFLSGPLDLAFSLQPAEQGAPGLLLSGCDFDPAASEMG